MTYWQSQERSALRSLRKARKLRRKYHKLMERYQRMAEDARARQRPEFVARHLDCPTTGSLQLLDLQRAADRYDHLASHYQRLRASAHSRVTRALARLTTCRKRREQEGERHAA